MQRFTKDKYPLKRNLFCLYPVSFIVLIDYAEISELKKTLKQDVSLQSKVYVPEKAKRNPSGISEIRVTIQTQGNDHINLVRQTIKSCGGTVKDTIDQGKPPMYVRVWEFFKKTSVTVILSYVAIVATTLSYQPKVNDAASMVLLFTAVSIPTAYAIASAHLVKLHTNSES